MARRVTIFILPFVLWLGASQAPAEEKPGREPAFAESEVTIRRPYGPTENGNSFPVGGSLRIPQRSKPEAGHPAVLFISGSGSQTRDGVQGGLDLGTREVLDAVAEAGFVVLATDDRGVGKTPIGPSGIRPAAIGYDALVGDARACLAWLAEHAETDPKRVFVLGHSEGGLTAPILAGEGSVAGIVFMAAMGRNMRETVRGQVEDALQAVPAEVRAAQLAVQDELMAAAAEEREPDYESLPEAVRQQARMAWQRVQPIKTYWREHFRIDVPTVHAAVTCPCFIAQGACDFQVTPERDAKTIAKNLLAGKATDVTYKVYDDLDHLFKPCDGKKSTVAMYATKRPVSRAFLGDLVAWLTARARAD